MKQGVDWVAKHWPRVRLAHEGFMLDKIVRQSRIVEQLAQNSMTGDVENVDAWPGHEGDDDMGVKIGDEIHYHAAPPKPDPPAPTPSTPPANQPPQTQPAEEPEPAWKTWAKRAALVAVGAGGIAGYQWMSKPPEENPPTIEQPAPPESVVKPGAYWKYGVEVLPPPEE